MPCPECRDLAAHEFRDANDMVHAFQVAAAELDRGVLRRIDTQPMGIAERQALESIVAAEAMTHVRYRFECALCGDRFELRADTAQGQGAWTRLEEP